MEIVMSRVQAGAEEMMSRHGFVGVPLEGFERGGRSHLVSLLNEGLNPESRILDFGCGVLRVAYWLVRFLDAGHYYGIEPARQRVEYGLRYLFTPGEIELKQPHFDFNPNFDSSVFGTQFDFFLATSIWTHACKRQIEASLDSFVRDAAPNAIFLTSYLPAKSPDEDYQGDRWVGTSHEGGTPGVICHSLTWIVAQCQKRALQLEELPGTNGDGQPWLRIRRSS
jgi:SAM-dependent methyltransferase